MRNFGDRNTSPKDGLKARKRSLIWLSIVSSIVVLIVIAVFGYFNYNDVPQNQPLGTYDDPEMAFKKTQKALQLLSTHLNTGIENVQYVEEYDKSKNLIFKPLKNKK